jgi:hypothetical protein
MRRDAPAAKTKIAMCILPPPVPRNSITIPPPPAMQSAKQSRAKTRPRQIDHCKSSHPAFMVSTRAQGFANAQCARHIHAVMHWLGRPLGDVPSRRITDRADELPQDRIFARHVVDKTGLSHGCSNAFGINRDAPRYDIDQS